MPQIIISPDSCKGCELCVHACPHGCRLCCITCPDMAIEMKVNGAMYHYFSY